MGISEIRENISNNKYLVYGSSLAVSMITTVAIKLLFASLGNFSPTLIFSASAYSSLSVLTDMAQLGEKTNKLNSCTFLFISTILSYQVAKRISGVSLGYFSIGIGLLSGVTGLVFQRCLEP